MYRSRQDLVIAALDNLGVTAEGQTPQVEDTRKVDDKLPSILAELRELNICYIQNVEQIPSAEFSALADVIAYGCRAMYGVTGDEAAALQQADMTARMNLRTMNSARPTYEPLAVLSF